MFQILHLRFAYETICHKIYFIYYYPYCYLRFIAICLEPASRNQPAAKKWLLAIGPFCGHCNIGPPGVVKISDRLTARLYTRFYDSHIYQVAILPFNIYMFYWVFAGKQKSADRSLSDILFRVHHFRSDPTFR
jgi:hypothetical protein